MPSIRRDVKRLKSDVHKLKDIVYDGLAHVTYRDVQSFNLTTEDAVVTYKERPLINTKAFIDLMLTNLPMWSTSTASGAYTLTGDIAGQNLAPEVRFNGGLVTWIIRNNSPVSADFRLYVLEVKESTASTPVSVITDNRTDNTALALTSTLLYPSDIDAFNLTFKAVVPCEKVHLESGQEYKFSVKIPGFKYNESMGDEDSNLFQARYNSMHVLFRTIGGIVHESATPSTIGYGHVDLDVIQSQVMKYQYDAGGAGVRYIKGVDTTSSITTSKQHHHFGTAGVTHS